MTTVDFLGIGGGVAGLSAAARLTRHGRVVVIEAEGALGYHSSGRSVSFSHYGIGDAAVRGLTAYSRAFYEQQPEGFCPTPLCRVMPSLYLGTEEMLPSLEALYQGMAVFTDAIEWVSDAEMKALCPALKTGPGGAVRGILDTSGLKLDSDALLQSFARALRAADGELLQGRRVASIQRRGQDWHVRSETGESWTAPVLVNAAGAWVDKIAAVAGVAPIGLEPKARKSVGVDPPAGTDGAESSGSAAGREKGRT